MEPGEQYTQRFLFLHGWGAGASDRQQLCRSLKEAYDMFKGLKVKAWQFVNSAMKAAIEEALENDSINIQRQFWRMSRDESARYALERIGLDKTYRDRYALMDR